MLYNERINKTLKLAYKAHLNQEDKGEIPYIYHLIHVAESMGTEDEIIVGLLHDILEDTDITEEYLLQNYPQPIVIAIKLLTRKKNESYEEYINNISMNNLARKVKIADLKHNCDTSRLKDITENDKQRIAKYKKALEILEKKSK